MLIGNIKNRIDNVCRSYVVQRNPYLQRPNNYDFSIVSSNCNGGVILHDMNLRFNSPFVNLWIKPNDFIKILNDLEFYMRQRMEFVSEKGVNYPIGEINGCRLYFEHYKNTSDALDSWNRRRERINFDNIFVMFTDRDGCTYENLFQFDKIPYSKVVFTHCPYPEIKSSFYIKGFENEECVGILTDYKPHCFGKRYLDDFDFHSWLNK